MAPLPWATVLPQAGVSLSPTVSTVNLKGNLEPAVLLGPVDLVRDRARDVLLRAAGRAGHIFNLGHGVPPDASVENLQVLVETVHSWVPERLA